MKPFRLSFLGATCALAAFALSGCNSVETIDARAVNAMMLQSADTLLYYMGSDSMTDYFLIKGKRYEVVRLSYPQYVPTANRKPFTSWKGQGEAFACKPYTTREILPNGVPHTQVYYRAVPKAQMRKSTAEETLDIIRANRQNPQ